MKKYYSKLTKEEKLKIKEQYHEKYDKSDFNIRIIRLRVVSIIGFIVSILIILDMILRDTEKVGNSIIAITLFLASVVFLIGSIELKFEVLNKIALKKK